MNDGEKVTETTTMGLVENKTEEVEETSIGSLLQEIVEAQGDLESQDSVKALRKHFASTLYPLMSKIVNFLGDIGSVVKDLAEDLGDQSEFMTGENVEYMTGYLEVIQGFILRYAAEAKYRADNGDTNLLNDLRALDQATRGAIEVMKSFVSDEDDDSDNDSEDADVRDE